jgi:hypothetical protein
MSMPGFTNLPGQRARGGNPTAGLIAVVLLGLAGLTVEGPRGAIRTASSGWPESSPWRGC